MLDNAAKKVREAVYFSHVLDEKRRELRQGNIEVLDFYLSAFLSAARSVTFVMQSEQKNNYDAWWPRWLAARTDEERRILEAIKDQRNLILKEGKAHVAPSWTLVDDDRMRSMEIHHIPPYLMGDWAFSSQVGVPTLRFTSVTGEGDGDDVVDTCKKAATLLEAALGDFVKICGA